MSKKMNKKKDIFDKIFSVKLLRFAEPFYQKHKEPLLYLFFGVLTTVISIAVFALFTEVFHCDALIANIISWILAVLFAFLTNRTWVFTVKNQGFVKQLVSFYLGRIATLLIEEGILFVFVKLLLWNALMIKIISQIVIIVLNYVISKLFVFKK